jgi:hypothetical protein
MLSAAEALMVAPRVTFKVYGENVVLAVLARMFGAKGVEQLMDEGAVEFVLWRPIVTQVMSEDLLAQGLSPLAYGNTNNPEHSDPHTSCIKGMNWSPQFDRKLRRSIARRAAKHMTTTPEEAPKQAVDELMAAYRDGRLSADGFLPCQDIVVPLT